LFDSASAGAPDLDVDRDPVLLPRFTPGLDPPRS